MRDPPRCCCCRPPRAVPACMRSPSSLAALPSAPGRRRRFYIMRLPRRGRTFERITYHAKVTQCLGGLQVGPGGACRQGRAGRLRGRQVGQHQAGLSCRLLSCSGRSCWAPLACRLAARLSSLPAATTTPPHHTCPAPAARQPLVPGGGAPHAVGAAPPGAGGPDRLPHPARRVCEDAQGHVARGCAHLPAPVGSAPLLGVIAGAPLYARSHTSPLLSLQARCLTPPLPTFTTWS